MKRTLIVLCLGIAVCVGLGAAFSMNSTVAIAEPSCTNWMKQSDGSSWRTCVDDKGRQYCEQSKDGHVTRVSCK
jgi:hypothetical protein